MELVGWLVTFHASTKNHLPMRGKNEDWGWAPEPLQTR